jgi:hypothetical protein
MQNFERNFIAVCRGMDRTGDRSAAAPPVLIVGRRHP